MPNWKDIHWKQCKEAYYKGGTVKISFIKRGQELLSLNYLNEISNFRNMVLARRDSWLQSSFREEPLDRFSHDRSCFVSYEPFKRKEGKRCLS